MENSADILLIIVSSVLSVFLILLIVLLIYLISLARQIKRLVQKAENVAINVEAAAQAFERSATPIAMLKVIGNIFEQIMNVKKRKG